MVVGAAVPVVAAVAPVVGRAAATAVVAVAAAPVVGGAGRGMGGGGGGGGFNPGMIADGSFDRLVKSYGGSGDTLDYSKIPNDVREQSNMMNQRFGSPPLPTSGSVTRADFKADIEKRFAARSGGSGGGGPAAPTATPSPGGSGTVVVIGGGPTDGKPGMTMTMTPGGPGGGGGGGWGGGGRGGPGGQGGQQDPESKFQEYLQAMDANKDGKLTREELQANRMGGRLLDSLDQYDANKDGALDLAEYKVLYAARMSMMGGGSGGGPGGWGGGGGGWGGGGPGGPADQARKLEEQDEPKPTVFRFGHLPQGLPAYFTDADSDKDGQVGLYEWVKYWDSSEAKLAEFKTLDLNGDGLLTVEEYMRAKKITPAMLAQADRPGRGGPQMPVGDGSGTMISPGAALEEQAKKGDTSSRDAKKDEKKDDKKDGRSNGGGPGGSGRFPGGGTGGTPGGSGTPGAGATPGGGRGPGGSGSAAVGTTPAGTSSIRAAVGVVAVVAARLSAQFRPPRSHLLRAGRARHPDLLDGD